MSTVLYIYTYISGIEIASHNIIKSFNKMLSSLLDIISNSHMKNSGDLLLKINNINMENKSLANLDIKSLYTFIPVNKCIKY